MKIFEEEKAQGATEYLLMLAAVLVIVALAVYFVISTGQSAENAASGNENDIIENLNQ